MKTEGFISRAFKEVKKLLKPEPVKNVTVWTPKPKPEIPKHETKTYHNPPCWGIAKDAGKKRRAKIRMTKKSRITNRAA
jgi:hypothetical protein